MKAGTKYFESVTKVMYLETNLTIHEEMKSRLNSPSLLSENSNFNTYRTPVFLVVLYWCETGLLTLREELG
jgi:hypothetical protein